MLISTKKINVIEIYKFKSTNQNVAESPGLLVVAYYAVFSVKGVFEPILHKIDTVSGHPKMANMMPTSERIKWLTLCAAVVVLVVSQFYITEAENEYVIKGNAAVVKCKIPSFVADFVQIEAWVDEEGVELWRDNASSSYEPVGSVGPRLTSGDESRILKVHMEHSATLLCPAQAYPVPFFSLFDILYLEPVGSVSPQLNGNGNQEHITLTRVPLNQSVALMCPAQAYPVPFFR
ncbi:hypothetical protein ACLKA6_019694 [Drosophila palustris]